MTCLAVALATTYKSQRIISSTNYCSMASAPKFQSKVFSAIGVKHHHKFDTSQVRITFKYFFPKKRKFSPTLTHLNDTIVLCYCWMCLQVSISKSLRSFWASTPTHFKSLTNVSFWLAVMIYKSFHHRSVCTYHNRPSTRWPHNNCWTSLHRASNRKVCSEFRLVFGKCQNSNSLTF